MVKFFDVTRQNEKIGNSLKAAIERVVASGKYILGEENELFDGEFANYIGAKHSIGVANGTEAITLSLRALGIGPGDEVITVSNTAFPTILAIENTGARTVFVDNGDDFCIDPSKIKNKITPRTKAIIPVHLYGYPCDLDAITEIANEHSIPIIEDACQAHGAEYRGRKVGTFGVTGAFSFYPTKNLGAFGDGGAITTNSEELADKIRSLRNCGQANREKYVHPLIGMNSRLDEIQAAILRIKLRHLDNWIAARRRIAKTYSQGIENEDVILPTETGNRKHVYHLYVLRSGERQRFIEHLSKEGIGTMIHYPIPAHLQKPFGNQTLVNAERFAKEIVSIPIYPELLEEEVNKVIESINSFR